MPDPFDNNEKWERALLNQSIGVLAREIGAELTAAGKHVTAAESLTGGMLCSSFVDVPGCSDWFSSGYVTYSNEAKHRMLGVSQAVLEKETAVSADTAIAMALGALRESGADYSLAVTGLAGPFADANGVPYPMDPRHEPGLVFVACACPAGAAVKRCVFTGSRNIIRRETVLSALEMLRKMMQYMR